MIIVLFIKILIIYLGSRRWCPDCLFCGYELNTKSDQKKHFAVRLFLSLDFFIKLQYRLCLQVLFICYLQVCSLKPAKIFDCVFCEASFETARGRTIHLNTCKMKPSPVADFSCLFCGDSFVLDRERIVHQFKCDKKL